MAEVSTSSAQPGAPAASPAVAGTAPAQRLGPKLLRVAWMSILLGIVLELLLLVAASFTGGVTARGVIADLVQKVSWASFVCLGLALGTSAAKARSEIMGLLGAISAPAGFVVARTLHKTVAYALGAGVAGGGASPFVMAALKGVEYALLGALLGALPGRPKGRTLTAHVVVGAIVGLVFGTGIVGFMAQHAPGPVTLAFVLPKAINELLFPLGCSLVLYFAEAAAGRVR